MSSEIDIGTVDALNEELLVIGTPVALPEHGWELAHLSATASAPPYGTQAYWEWRVAKITALEAA